jgi:hypothetical protein
MPIVDEIPDTILNAALEDITSIEGYNATTGSTFAKSLWYFGTDQLDTDSLDVTTLA